MKYLTIGILILMLIGSSVANVNAQQPQLATYRETAHVLVDGMVENRTTAFITLASTSPLEIRVPSDLDAKIRNTANVTSVVITNANKCILGVQDQICVLINIVEPSLVESYNITKIQSDAHIVGDTLIDNINKAFALNAGFNSVFVNPKGALNSALGTSGVVSGNRTISVVYTMPRQDSSYLYDGLAAILLPKQIRDAGGFYDVAKKMANDSNSTVSFVITPAHDVSLYQLQVEKNFPLKNKITTVRPLELFGVDKLDRSTYFSGGFFPLNSILEVVVLSNNTISVTSHGGGTVPTTIKDGHNLPTDLTKSGWVFDPDSGQKIIGVYLFGTTTEATDSDLALSLGAATSEIPTQPIQNTTKPSFDYSIYILIGIIGAGGAAIYLFMKRR